MGDFIIEDSIAVGQAMCALLRQFGEVKFTAAGDAFFQMDCASEQCGKMEVAILRQEAAPVVNFSKVAPINMDDMKVINDYVQVLGKARAWIHPSSRRMQ
jgi:hypothetical protein